MPSQKQLPNSAKLDSLPKDLRKVADRLIKEKFKLPDEPTMGDLLQPADVKRYTYALIPRGYSTRYGGAYSSYYTQTLVDFPRYIEIPYYPDSDPVEIARQLENMVAKYEAQTGMTFEVKRM